MAVAKDKLNCVASDRPDPVDPQIERGRGGLATQPRRLA